MVYEHKHGTDSGLFDSELAAQKKAAAIVLEYLEEEIESLDVRKSIVGAVMEGQYIKAIRLYGDNCNETFEICEERIEPSPDEALEHQLERAKSALLKEQQENKEDSES
jgi:hypothetical protein